MGDFNVDFLPCSQNSFSQEFLDIILAPSFIPIIGRPTRITEQSATLIDNILTNVYPLPEAGIVLSDITDHFPVFAPKKDLISCPKSTISKLTRKLTSDNVNKFKQNLSIIHWFEVLVLQYSNEYFDVYGNINSYL